MFRVSCRPFFLLLTACLLLIPGGFAVASRCAFSKQESGITVEPARPWKGPDDPLKVAVVLLRQYLDHAKRPKEVARVDVDQAGEMLIARWKDKEIEARFSFPGGLNASLLDLTERLSDEMKLRIKMKKILPYLNEASSGAAYLRYADGILALSEGPSTKAAERAAAAFDQAIKADYNYVFAYAGLAEAQAMLAALGGPETLKVSARSNWEKAKLLNPYRAKIREESYEWYLKKAKCGVRP